MLGKGFISLIANIQSGVQANGYSKRRLYVINREKLSYPDDIYDII